jgi:hypothetical protein
MKQTYRQGNLMSWDGRTKQGSSEDLLLTTIYVEIRVHPDRSHVDKGRVSFKVTHAQGIFRLELLTGCVTFKETLPQCTNLLSIQAVVLLLCRLAYHSTAQVDQLTQEQLSLLAF